MADKQKRTILLGEGAKSYKKPFSYYLHPKRAGVGGTIGEVNRGDKPSIRLKWRAGAIAGSKGAEYKKGRHMGRLHKKSRPGFKVTVKF